MKNPTRLVFASLMLLTFVLPVWADSHTMNHGEAIHHDTSPPLREMAATTAGAAFPGVNKEVPLRQRPDFARDPSKAAPDGGLESQSYYVQAQALLGPSRPAACR